MTEKLLTLSLSCGPPWGFRLRGGPAQGLRVSRVRRRSPASAGGLREGDFLLSVNSVPAAGRTYAFVMELAERQRHLLLEVRRFVSAETTLVAAPSLDSEEDFEDFEEAPLQELQVAELQPLQAPPALVDEASVMPADPEVRPVPFSKLITEAVPEPTPPRSPTKKYADSAYFDASSMAYPTVEEQKEMAKKVAETLTDRRNQGSRGASMFERRRERAEKFTLEGPDPGLLQPQEPTAMIDTSVGPPAEGREDHGITKLPIPPPPPTPPPPPGAPFRFSTVRDPPPKTVAEYVEREMRSAPKLTHKDYDPKKAFDIASALHSGGGKAAQMFQKRRQRAVKFTTESEGRAAPAVGQSPMQQQPAGGDASLSAKIQRLQQQQPPGAGHSDL